ncbi:pilus assembly protein [Agarivorans sp. Alg241-V36]|uniref:pilus assembly protein n=1 Tax=Agarivorans sp. Alg241-V36 TaxID=2305992 RepID=UPI0013D241F5|nr:PilC/PilY family type IV pilus protein [Agarivorans sp. Alg241-V36]
MANYNRPCTVKSLLKLAIFSLGLSASATSANNLALATKPLYVAQYLPPMVMLVMSRDHSLFYEVYNDYSSIKGDDNIDLDFSPSKHDYFGLFDSHLCYKYGLADEDDSNSGSLFVPVAGVSNELTKTCTGNNWSGDFLNYLTTTRMDALRVVLYGGHRVVDTDSRTVLERAFIPRDAHSWGKSYNKKKNKENTLTENYNISDYTPFDMDEEKTTSLFFGTATFSEGGLPELRVYEEATGYIWSWATSHRPVLSENNGAVKDKESKTYTVQVEVCNEDWLEDHCKRYASGAYKPTGLLHDYGENGQIQFGLLTGSYDKNLSGGVLRKAVGDFSNEIESNSGIFKTSSRGIVDTINKIRIYGFNYTGSGENHAYNTNCGWIVDKSISDGECVSWGNPIGEMLFESLRYFYGETTPSDTFAGGGTIDTALDLPNVSVWEDPYQRVDENGNPSETTNSFRDSQRYCASAHNLVISDVSPTFDSDSLPEAQDFDSNDVTWAGTLNSMTHNGGFSTAKLLATVGDHENISGTANADKKFFIGEVVEKGVNNADQAPTPKKITSLHAARGLAPLGPTLKGSYTSVAAAYYGNKHDMFPERNGKQNIKTTVVGLSSPFPEIKVDIDGEIITIVPFAKTVGGEYNGNTVPSGTNSFQPSSTIVDVYVDKLESDSGTFRVNYEDVEQGADHEMDMIVEYSYKVLSGLCPNAYDADCTNGKKGVQLTLKKVDFATAYQMHAGYIISGTDGKDGIYLDIRGKNGVYTTYHLDTPNEEESPYPNNSREWAKDNASPMPTERTRNFFPGSSSGKFLPSPLWLAAKWGGFDDESNDDLPQAGEWDKEVAGEPDNYFPVTNAGQLGEQLGNAFEKIATGTKSGNPPVFSNTFLNTNTKLYQSTFDGEYWSGDVKAFETDGNGGFKTTAVWSAATQLDKQGFASRKIYTINSNTKKAVAFDVPSSLDGGDTTLSKTQITDLLSEYTGSNDDSEKLSYLEAVINYLKGERTHEGASTSYVMRKRLSALGDVINSIPLYVGAATGHSVKKPVLVFGANDGMVHIIDVDTGDEIMAYIPSQAIQGLGRLTKGSYEHQYYVDGATSAYTLDDKTYVVGRLGHGFKGLYALNVTNMNNANSNKIKWEIDETTTGYSGLGYGQTKPAIVELANGDVGVVFENGYNSTDPEGAIYIADLKTGKLIETLKVGSQQDPTGLDRPNALASPAVVDLDGDGVVDRIYAGDLFGNMWAFDISSDDSDDWGVAHDDKPLFTATSPNKEDGKYIAQAITTKPSVGAHPNGRPQDVGVLVAFGTGKYLEISDTNSIGEPTQTVYAIWDKLQSDSSLSNTRQLVGQISDYTTDINGKTLLRQAIARETETKRLLTTNEINWNMHNGWYLDLIDSANGNADPTNSQSKNYGERQVTNSLLFGSKLSFTTLLPSTNVCEAGGDGWFMEVDLYSGQTDNPGKGDPDQPWGDDPIKEDSSHEKVNGVLSPPVLIVDTETEGKVVFKTGVTSSDGETYFYDKEEDVAGRLNLRKLH